MMKKLFLMTTMFCAGIATAQAEQYKLENRTLKPRVDLTARSGNSHNHIGTIGAWVPLSQNDNEVLYSDFRFTRQNSDNDEANIGIGYRSMNIVPNAVVGAHVWYDNRHTNRGSIVHQATVGAEYMSDKFEARANVYAPIASHAKTWITPNVGSTTPYLAGTGIYVDTTGIIIEEPQPGFDIEFGAPFTPAEKYIDSLRIYGGVYNFHGDKTPDVSGVRVRAVADINPAFQIGTRLQTDIRGAQAYLEATLRFPWSAKLMKKREGLRSHLDEAPIRDIDIVTGSYIDTGGQKPVLNTESGQAQRVLHVDNTATAGGDGSKDHPFNTLAAAQAALTDNDVLYIHAGDGTSIGQNAGLSIEKNNLQMVGSGTNFVWDGTRFSTSSGNISNGIVIAAATTAPVITNTAGIGVYVSGANAFLTGFTVDGATAEGIMGDFNGIDGGSFTVRNVTSRNNASFGITAQASAATLDTIEFKNTITSGNGTQNLRADINTSSTVGSLIMDGNTASNTATNLRVSVSASSLGSATITNNNATVSTSRSLLFSAGASTVDDVTVSNNTIGGSTGSNGAEIQSTTNALITTLTASNNITSNNAVNGLYVFAQTGGDFGTVSVSNSTANSNTGTGIRVDANGAGTTIGTSTLTGNTTNLNTALGQSMLAASGGVITTAAINNATATSNTGGGLRLEATGANSLISAANAANNTINTSGSIGLYIRAASNGDIGATTLTNNISNGNTGATGRGIQVESNSAGSSITSATLTGNTANNNASNGTYLVAITSSTFTSATVSNNTTNSNGHIGTYFQALTGSTMGTVSLTNSTSSSNTGATGRGIQVESNGVGSTMGSVTLSGNTANSNASNGTYLVAITSSAFTSATVSNHTTNGNGHIGTYMQALTGSTIGTLSLSNSTSSSNTGANGRGIQLEANGAGSTITSATLAGNTTSNNAAQGHYVSALTSGVITTASITGATANANVSEGIQASATTLGSINTVNITGSTSTNNTGASGRGIEVVSNGNAGTAINNVNLTDNAVSGNAQQGMYVWGNTAGVLNNAKLTHNTSTANTGNGVFIDDDTTGTFLVDMGGGALSGTGQNRIFSNTGTEMRVDLDGGQLKAENNWWGVGTGLAGGETTLDAASTIDAAPFLATDPGP